MIKYLIVDDEYIAHDIIKGYCDLLPNMQLMKNCYDAIEAFEYLNKNKVDLIFLDLNMPVLKGFDFLKTLGNPPKIIVTTAYQEYALEGYELNISDYLLKPFSFERLLKAVNKAMDTAGNVNILPVQADVVPKRIFIQSNKNHIQIAVDTLLYIEAVGNYSKIVTTVETISVREKISTLLEMLPMGTVIQVHKSFAVAPMHINRIEGGRIFMGTNIIPIGKTFRTNVVQLLK